MEEGGAVAVTLPIDSRLVVSKKQVACHVGDEVAILNLKNSTYYRLDPIGARVWQLIQQPVTLAQIHDALKGEYDVEPAQLEVDIRDLLEQLAEQGLLENAQ